jgi:hypothetical protein
MPKSRGRRRPPHRHLISGRPDLPPWARAIFQADEAERRGDAAGALEVMASAGDVQGEQIWRPWRTAYLTQFAELGPLLPRWAFSRWVLAQAAQWLDGESRQGTHTAMQTAIDVRGGASTLPGRDSIDRRARVMDHDWVYRQLVLYEFGKLDRFCRRRATGDLLAGADDMGEWSRARIDVYRLFSRGSSNVTWQRERDDALLRTPNTGCASMLWPGDAVLGRVTPTEGGQVFESPPLPVTDEVASRVAAEPDCWLTVLGEWELYSEVVPLTRPREHDGLVVELPPRIWQNVVCDQPDTRSLPSFSPGELARGALSLGRFMLDEFEPPDFPHLDTWACLAAAFVEPAVVRHLVDHAGVSDRELLAELAGSLAEPASTVCQRLADGDLPLAA